MNRLSTVLTITLIAFLLTSTLAAMSQPSINRTFFPSLFQSADAFSLDIHKTVTDEEFSFLKKPILAQIDEGHKEADENLVNQATAAYHFDDCNFQEGTQHINEVYTTRVIPNLDPKGFGVAIHAAMDFYAHSNWVEMGKTNLIDNGNGLWRVLHSGDNIGGVIVLEADLKGGALRNPLPGLFLPYPATIDFSIPKIPMVTFDNGKERLPGLISGRVPPPYPPGSYVHCASGTPGHWDLFSGDGSGLNKDTTNRNGIIQAISLARQQVRHEWCRLVNLVQKTSGEAALDKLIDTWVDDPSKAPCIPTYQGAFHFTDNFDSASEFSSEHDSSSSDGKFVFYGGTALSGEGTYAFTDKSSESGNLTRATPDEDKSGNGPISIEGTYDPNTHVAKINVEGVQGNYGPSCTSGAPDPEELASCSNDPFALNLSNGYDVYDKQFQTDSGHIIHLQVAVKRLQLSGDQAYSSSLNSESQLNNNNNDNVIQQEKALVHTGISLYNQGNFPAAIEKYDKALQINSTDARVWYDKGLALSALGRHPDAIAAYDNVLKIDASYVDAFMAKGIDLFNLGRYQEAIQSYENALQLRPNDASILTNIGSALDAEGRYQEAIPFYDKALQIDHNHVNALIGKGTALYGLGRYQEALQWYNKALEIDPNNSDAIHAKEIAKQQQQQQI